MPKVKDIHWPLSKANEFSTNIYSETVWLIEAKFHVEPSWNWWT